MQSGVQNCVQTKTHFISYTVIEVSTKTSPSVRCAWWSIRKKLQLSPEVKVSGSETKQVLGKFANRSPSVATWPQVRSVILTDRALRRLNPVIVFVARGTVVSTKYSENYCFQLGSRSEHFVRARRYKVWNFPKNILLRFLRTQIDRKYLLALGLVSVPVPRQTANIWNLVHTCLR